MLSDGSMNCFITDTEQLNYIEKTLNGSKKFTRLHEIILSDHLGFKFRNNDFMFSPINRIITQLHESGISDWIVKNEGAFVYQEEKSDAVILDLKHIDIWFYYLLISFIGAVFIFIIEYLLRPNHAKNMRSKLLKKSKRSRRFARTLIIDTDFEIQS